MNNGLVPASFAAGEVNGLGIGGSGGVGGGPSFKVTQGAAPPLSGPEHKRVYQACIPCRRRKVKCDLGSVDNPHDPPCVRCRRESKECFFSATRRKRRADELDAGAGARDSGGHGSGLDDDLDLDEDYVVRNGRKRIHMNEDTPPPSHARDHHGPGYRDAPLTPGGSMGRSEPLRRPAYHQMGGSSHSNDGGGGLGLVNGNSGSHRRELGRARDNFGGGDPNSPLENFEARTVMRKEVYNPHDALNLLYKAATAGKHGLSTVSPDVGSRSSGILSGGLDNAGGGRQLYSGQDTANKSALATPKVMLNSRTTTAQFENAARWARSEASIDPQLGKVDAVVTPEDTAGHAVALKAWARFRFVRAGWFTAQEAIDYIEYYFKYLSPLTPISPPTFREPASHPTLLTEEPVLAVTILTIASRYCKMPNPGGESRSYAIHDQLWRYLRGMVERVMWGQEAFGGAVTTAEDYQTSSTEPGRGIRRGSLRTIGTIMSLMILTEWHPRALHFPPTESLDELMVPSYESLRDESGESIGEDQQPTMSMGGKRIESWLEPAWRSDRMCWMLLTTAMGLGYELGVFDDVDELLKAGTITRPEYQDESYRLRAGRTKKLILIYLSQLAGRLGWTNMVPEKLRKDASSTRRPRPMSTEGTTPGTTFSMSSTGFNFIPDLELDDQIIHCWAGISNAMHHGNEKLFKSRKYTTEIIQDRRYIALLKEFQPILKDWWKEFRQFKLPEYIEHILIIEYEYVRIYINSLSLQAVVDRSAQVASSTTMVPASADGIANPERNGLSPKTQDAFGKLPLGKLGGFGADDKEYIKEVVDGCRNLLRTVVNGLLPGGYLKHAPVRTYFRIISGAMFLLKTFALGATKHDVQISIGLMDETVNALRSCVVDDVHLGIRFADLLENLTSRLRNRFRHAGGPGPDDGGVVSTGSKSPMMEPHQQLQQQLSLGIRGDTSVLSNERGAPNESLSGSHNGVDSWAKARDMLGGGRENTSTPANISATAFDLPFTSNSFSSALFRSNTPGIGSDLPNFDADLGSTSGVNRSIVGINSGNGSNSNNNINKSSNNNNSNTNNNVFDMFGGDGSDWTVPGNEMWYLPAGPAFFQNLSTENATTGLSAEGVNVGGLDLLDYMTMETFNEG